jgi:hypothetical protein
VGPEQVAGRPRLARQPGEGLGDALAGLLHRRHGDRGLAAREVIVELALAAEQGDGGVDDRLAVLGDGGHGGSSAVVSISTLY